MNQAATPIIAPDEYVNQALADATHAFNFLKESGTLAASLIFNVAHRIPGHDQLLFGLRAVLGKRYQIQVSSDESRFNILG